MSESSVLRHEWSKVPAPIAENALGQFPIQLSWLSGHTVQYRCKCWETINLDE